MSKHQYDFEPLPPYADARTALKVALPSIKPAENITVTDAAERSMRVNVAGQWQEFRRDVTPYMVEPTDMVPSRMYRGLAFCGPSQSGKTQMLQSCVSYTITSNPGRVALFQMTRDAAGEFEQDKLSPMVRNSPDLKAKIGKGRGANITHQKIYVGGTRLTLDWPVITKLSSSTIRWVLMTDYDHFPDSIDGEGTGYELARARTKSYKSRGMVVCESSPGAPIIDETWRAKSIHDSPPVKSGILGLYPQGTRGRWYWPCPGCEKMFEPTFRRLNFPKTLDPVEAGEAAEMPCPYCGECFSHSLKRELNAAGEWFHETSDGKMARLDSGLVRQTDLLSYWLDGAAAAFSSWSELVQQEVMALERFKNTGDEESLKTARNTGQAQPYTPQGALSENEITLQGLKDKSNGVSTVKGVAPSWTKYILISVDTQKSSFVVAVTAYGDNGIHQVIDRFELATPPARDDGTVERRTLDPFDVAEDWAVLEPLSGMVFPVEGQMYGLTPACVGVDMQGGGSTTENAYTFYRGRRKASESKLWYLTRGSGGKHTDRIWLKAPERANKGRKVATDILIMNMATDRLKDACSTSLRLEARGRNYCHIPEWMEEKHLIEYTAEHLTTKGWEKRKGMVRNESLDLLVQARAMHIHLGGEKIDPDRPPNWAIGGSTNRYAVKLDVIPEPDGPKLIQKPKAPKRRTGNMRI